MRPRAQPPLVVLIMVLACLVAPTLPAAVAAGVPLSSTLTIGLPSLPTTLNPLIGPPLPRNDISDAIFDSLLSVDTHDVLQPELASSYAIDPNGLRYEFHLDPHARWQDGEPVTADDVLFTARLMRDRQFPAYNRFGFGNIASLVADGPLTVTATLRAPYAPFLRAFSTTPLLPAHVLGPIPVAQIAAYQSFNRLPVGSGPYRVAEFQQGDHVTLSAVRSYFRGAPHIAQIVFRLERSEHAALADLRAGMVQMLGPSMGVTPQHVLTALESGTLSAYAAPGFGWTHIDLIESGSLRDRAVRQALTYATPRQRIVATVFAGLVTQADADQPPTSQYYEPRVAASFPYSIARSAALLTGRGYRRNKAGHFAHGREELRLTLWTDGGCPSCVAVARIVAASWGTAGMPTTLRLVPTSLLFGLHGPLYDPGRLRSSRLNAVLYTWEVSPEPDDSFYWATSSIVRPGHLSGGNFDGYSNPLVDRLAAEALVATDGSVRSDLYRAIQRQLVADQPDVFLYWTAHLSLATARLHGYEANPFQPGVTWNVTSWEIR